MGDDIVTRLRDMATDHGRHRTHYDGCDQWHLECAALLVCDAIEQLNAVGIFAEIARLRFVGDRLAAAYEAETQPQDDRQWAISKAWDEARRG